MLDVPSYPDGGIFSCSRKSCRSIDRILELSMNFLHSSQFPIYIWIYKIYYLRP
jgi:hypothetical protein